MALNDTQKHNIIFYLGWPAKTLISGSTHYQKTVNDRLNNLDIPTESIVNKLITKLKDLDTKLDSAACRFSTEQVGDIKLNSDERRLLLQERRRVRDELSALVDIPVLSAGGVMANVTV